MRLFVWGVLVGVVSCLIFILIVWSQYTDYRVRAHSAAWLQHFVQSDQKTDIEHALQRQHRVTPTTQEVGQARVQVLAQGVVIYQAMRNGAIMLLYPVQQGQQVIWYCVGGHHVDTPTSCTSPLLLSSQD